MGPLRGFATYLHTLDPTVEIPPPGLFGGPPARAVPYLYSDSEIITLIGVSDAPRRHLDRVDLLARGDAAPEEILPHRPRRIERH